jgi:hypothetical protein
MIETEPKELIFREVRLNQSYTSSLCLTNNQAISIDITIRPSSNRYHVSPSRVHLNSGQSIIVTVRLHITHFPNHSAGVRGHVDSLQLSSSFFEQKVDVHFFLTAKKNVARPRSLSPVRGVQQVPGGNRIGSSEEQSSFEEKSKRVRKEECAYGWINNLNVQALQILRLKDDKIIALENELNQLQEMKLHKRDSIDTTYYEDTILELQRENASLRKQIQDRNGEIVQSNRKQQQQSHIDELENLREKTLDQAEQIEVQHSIQQCEKWWSQ